MNGQITLQLWRQLRWRWTINAQERDCDGGVMYSLVLQRPEPAQAGAFATEFTQILNHGQLVMEYIRQGQQLATQIDQYKDQIRNVKNLPAQVFGSISGRPELARDGSSGWAGAGILAGGAGCQVPIRIHGLWHQFKRLLSELQEMGGDNTGYDAQHVESGRPAR